MKGKPVDMVRVRRIDAAMLELRQSMTASRAARIIAEREGLSARTVENIAQRKSSYSGIPR
jgi:hypothetical protein